MEAAHSRAGAGTGESGRGWAEAGLAGLRVCLWAAVVLKRRVVWSYGTWVFLAAPWGWQAGGREVSEEVEAEVQKGDDRLSPGTVSSVRRREQV